MVLGRRCQIAWVAITCATSEEPMPKLMAPSAPWVEVWESPHTRVMPGRVMPCSGPTTWAIPCRASPQGKSWTPNSAQLSPIAWVISRTLASVMASSEAVCVGV